MIVRGLLKRSLVYFNDSVAMKVYAYDFDLESGSISNRRLFIDRRSTYGEPDGMVVEYVGRIMTTWDQALTDISTQGNLWIAVFASYRVSEDKLQWRI